MRNINKIIAKTVRKVLNESLNEGYDDFTIAMNKLYKAVRDEFGSDSIRSTIAGWFFDFDKWDNESKIIPCKYSERGMYELLYTVCNYDLICINRKTIDIANSNHTNIARLLKPYVNSKMCATIYSNWFD